MVKRCRNLTQKVEGQTRTETLVNRGDSHGLSQPVAICQLERVKGIEPSFRRIPFYSSANLCFTRGKLALLGFVSYIELHSNEWQKRNY